MLTCLVKVWANSGFELFKNTAEGVHRGNINKNQNGKLPLKIGNKSETDLHEETRALRPTGEGNDYDRIQRETRTVYARGQGNTGENSQGAGLTTRQKRRENRDRK